MDQIDEFESMFRRAEREPFSYADIPIESVVLVSDDPPDVTAGHQATVQRFIPALSSVSSWRFITGDQYRNVSELIAKIDEQQTDLVVTHRHLHEESFVPQHSLGVYLDVLTQSTSIPILVMPGTAAQPRDLSNEICDRTMVVADHISGDSQLVNYGVRFCPDDGTLWLCHVEDDAVFDRYMDVISRIPEIDSDQARELISAQLEKESTDYIETCLKVLRKARPSLTYNSQVTRGHFLKHYQDLIEEAEIDLLVTNTKNEDQLAMHGMAYSLSVELINTAMLLL